LYAVHVRERRDSDAVSRLQPAPLAIDGSARGVALAHELAGLIAGRNARDDTRLPRAHEGAERSRLQRLQRASELAHELQQHRRRLALVKARAVGYGRRDELDCHLGLHRLSLRQALQGRGHDAQWQWRDATTLQRAQQRGRFTQV